MKVIFLDIDGVLNVNGCEQRDDGPNMDECRLELVKELADKSGAKVVLISTWRRMWEPGCDFDNRFREAGITIFDVTPFLLIRRVEISRWLKAHPEVDGYVILDDGVDMWDELEPHVVNTDPEVYGLQPEHIEKALKVLKMGL